MIKTLLEVQKDNRRRNTRRVRDYKAEYQARRAKAHANGYRSVWDADGRMEASA